MKVARDHGLKWAWESASEAPDNLECLLKATIRVELEDIMLDIKLNHMVNMAATLKFLLENVSFQGQLQNGVWKSR